jgi:hypothetical protein
MIPEGMAQHVADAHLLQQQQQAAASASHNSGSSSRHSSSSAVPATQFPAPHGHGRGKGGKGLWLASTVPKIETVPAAMLAAAGVPTLNTQATFRSVAAAAAAWVTPTRRWSPTQQQPAGLLDLLRQQRATYLTPTRRWSPTQQQPAGLWHFLPSCSLSCSISVSTPQHS